MVAGELVRSACQRHLDDLETGHERGLVFDEDLAQYALDYFPNNLKHSKGEWAGEPFCLEPWQQFCTAAVFGWIQANGRRRFRQVYIEVARKNGKTTWLAGIGVLMLEGDDEPGAEVYSAATKRDQAKLCFNEAKQMVKRGDFPHVNALLARILFPIYFNACF